MATSKSNGDTHGVDADFQEFLNLPGDSIEGKIESAVKKNK
jgi:hypothetical protein